MHSFQKIPGSFGEGAYSLVFLTSDGLATKVFKRRPDASEQHVKDVFKSEVEAYNIASKIKELRILIPHFYGQITCSRITNEKGLDISGEFYLNYAYQTKRVFGSFRKFGDIPREKTQSVQDLFRLAGINYVLDSCVLLGDNDEITCIIDFATKEYVLGTSGDSMRWSSKNGQLIKPLFLIAVFPQILSD